MTFLGMPGSARGRWRRRSPGDRDDPPPGHGDIRGHEPYPAAAARALRDSQLRRNLGHATATIRAKREHAVAELPDWEELRAAGSAIKADTLARLPELLGELEAAVVAHGGQVHWACDASEANEIVTRVVRATGATEVVKVKSMATQEIGLNDALLEAGVRPVETDLAELIVQLGRDRPSHILVPAIHRNRAEIRDLFARELLPGARAGGSAGAGAGAEAGASGRAGAGAEAGAGAGAGEQAGALTDEPRVLADAARRHLRQAFLTARVAVSGANLAVAETGTIAVVESEGNGRMCLTLPQTLVTVMGIEKVVPSWADLAVFLQLLPRSSTGERMNPYTSMWTGVTPGDGPQEFHLVLLDNGRTAALADPVGRSALHCIRCSACLNVCPVYERAGGHAYGSVYPGPIGAVLSPQLSGIEGGDDPNASLPFASSLCGACYDVCPVKIDIPALLVHLRERAVDATRAGRVLPAAEAAGMSSLAWLMADERRFARAQAASRLGRRLARDGRISSLPGPGAAWTASRDLPEPPAETFRQWWARERG